MSQSSVSLGRAFFSDGLKIRFAVVAISNKKNNGTAMNKARLILILILCVVAWVSAAGCGSKSTPDGILASANETNIQRLGNLYTKYQSTHGWIGPADDAAFKEFISKLDAEKLARIGVEPGKTDDLFISERDGKPFKIRYSIKGSPRGCNEPAIFESTGANGNRMVGFLNMVQREVGDAEYEKLWAGEFTAPAAPSNPVGR